MQQHNTTTPSFLQPILAAKRRQLAQDQQRVPRAILEAQAAKAEAPRDFYGALAGDSVKIIAEIKRASPSRGDIDSSLDVAQLAAAYERGGAAALSVLTEPDFFKGSLADLQAARAATNLPVLRKDFILEPYQVYESRACGADAILLIVRILSDQQLHELFQLAQALQLAVLVEVFDAADARRVTHLAATLTGVNNRNLESFVTDIGQTARIAAHLPPSTSVVALSGINSIHDIRQNIAAGVTRFLIGEALVRQEDPARTIREWISA